MIRYGNGVKAVTFGCFNELRNGQHAVAGVGVAMQLAANIANGNQLLGGIGCKLAVTFTKLRCDPLQIKFGVNIFLSF